MKNKLIISSDLTDKLILITGSSHGLGAYYAEMLSKNNATVIVSGRDSVKVNKIVENIRAKQGKAYPLMLDMCDFKSFDKKIEEVIDKYGHIDVLINNAAISKDKGLFEITEEDWDLHFNTNTKGLFFLSQAVAHQMKKQKSGSIINIAAINGEKVRKNCIAFGASKSTVFHLTKSMAYELIEYNIRVNAISLGLFPSEAVQDWLDTNPNAQEYLKRIPMQREGKFNDLDGPILLLASDASQYMTGSVLNVDGGFTIDVFMDVDF